MSNWRKKIRKSAGSTYDHEAAIKPDFGPGDVIECICSAYGRIDCFDKFRVRRVWKKSNRYWAVEIERLEKDPSSYNPVSSSYQARNFRKVKEMEYWFTFAEIGSNDVPGEVGTFRGNSKEFGEFMEDIIRRNPRAQYYTGRFSRILEIDEPPIRCTEI
jgi:hypothetical protein